MGTYRIEISVSARAGCQATHCKKEGVKIQKGELRQGTWVEAGDYQSWKWRHWGCVTPTVIHNWTEDAKGDSDTVNVDLIDGYDELPSEAQEKVKRSFDQGHVDDDEWNGDEDMNRYNPKNPRQGMFGKAKKAKNDEDEEATSPKPKKTAKKRTRKGDDEAEEADEPAAKKSRSKKAVKPEPKDESMEDAAPKKSRSKKAIKPEPEDESIEDAGPKKGRSKKGVKPEPKDDFVDEKPAAKTSRAKKAVKSEPPTEAANDAPRAEKITKAKSIKAEADESTNQDPPAAETSKKTKATKSKLSNVKPKITKDSKDQDEDAEDALVPKVKSRRTKAGGVGVSSETVNADDVELPEPPKRKGGRSKKAAPADD